MVPSLTFWESVISASPVCGRDWSLETLLENLPKELHPDTPLGRLRLVDYLLLPQIPQELLPDALEVDPDDLPIESSWMIEEIRAFRAFLANPMTVNKVLPTKVQWLPYLTEEQHERLRQDEWFCHKAASEGNLMLLVWAREHDCPCKYSTCVAAIFCDNLEILKWMSANGFCLSNAWVYAVECGNLHILQWLCNNGCSLDEDVFAKAAYHGHLHILQWLHASKCPGDERACAEAARRGRTVVLQWLHENDYPWDERTCSKAAAGGHLETLQYARANKCPWDFRTVFNAVMGSNQNIVLLQWVVKNKCPWNDSKCRKYLDGETRELVDDILVDLNVKGWLPDYMGF